MGGFRIFVLFFCITHFLAINNAQQEVARREALEIIIGGGGTPSPPDYPDYPPPPSCPPPSPPPCPPPPPIPCPPPPQPPKISPPPPSPKHSPPPPPSPPPPSPPPSPPPPSPRKSLPPPPPSPRKSPPPPPPPRKSPPPPPNSPFASTRIELVYPVIQKFKLLITEDPKGITKTWNGPDVCNYTGFKCDIVPDKKKIALAGVNFNKYNFYGPNLAISEFIVGLPDIVYFHANSNNLTGTIPTDISKLRYFYELDLSNNKFSCQFPYQVLGATKLQFLDLRFNTFMGTVPPQIFNLKLDLLFINNNNFVPQTLPRNLGSTTALYLVVANNKFIGEIPKSIGQASNTLLEVLFLNNQLTGCLPYEIGLLKKTTLFDVGFNHLMGPIPHSFQCLKKMELLNLAHNSFSGVVPEAVCSLPDLTNFTISYNYFTQVGEKCRHLIKTGVLDVKMNCILDLPNQRSPAECAKFFSHPHNCPDEKSLTYVPCSEAYSKDQPELSDGKWTTPAPKMAPTQSPLGRSYGSLSPH